MESVYYGIRGIHFRPWRNQNAVMAAEERIDEIVWWAAGQIIWDALPRSGLWIP